MPWGADDASGPLRGSFQTSAEARVSKFTWTKQVGLQTGFTRPGHGWFLLGINPAILIEPLVQQASIAGNGNRLAAIGRAKFAKDRRHMMINGFG